MSDYVLSRPRGEAEWAAYHDLRRTEIFDNEPSRKVILANGGAFERGYPTEGKTKLSFWIDLLAC